MSEGALAFDFSGFNLVEGSTLKFSLRSFVSLLLRGMGVPFFCFVVISSIPICSFTIS